MELNREQITRQMREWSDSICKNACLRCMRLNGKTFTCEVCVSKMVKEALSLIKELTEENERLREENEILKMKRVTIFERIKSHDIGYEKGVRKFAERLHKDATVKLAGVDLFVPIAHSSVDRIEKEMLEGAGR